MKYVVLLAEADHYTKWDDADPAQRDRVRDDFRAFGQAVSTRGTILAGEALDRPDTARTVRPGAEGAEREVTHGPYAESVEQVGGFYLVDLPDRETAVELAALLPREYAVEVRPVLEVDI